MVYGEDLLEMIWLAVRSFVQWCGPRYFISHPAKLTFPKLYKKNNKQQTENGRQKRQNTNSAQQNVKRCSLGYFWNSVCMRLAVTSALWNYKHLPKMQDNLSSSFSRRDVPLLTSLFHVLDLTARPQNRGTECVILYFGVSHLTHQPLSFLVSHDHAGTALWVVFAPK